MTWARTCGCAAHTRYRASIKHSDASTKSSRAKHDQKVRFQFFCSKLPREGTHTHHRDALGSQSLTHASSQTLARRIFRFSLSCFLCQSGRLFRRLRSSDFRSIVTPVTRRFFVISCKNMTRWARVSTFTTYKVPFDPDNNDSQAQRPPFFKSNSQSWIVRRMRRWHSS